MSLLDGIGRALVIAPHPDDEVLGCGGTMARLADMGREVHVAIVTRGMPPRFDPADVDAVRKEAEAAHDLLGVRETHYLDLPAAELDGIPHSRVNEAISGLVARLAPDSLFLPFIGDVHVDHQLIFTSGMVAARPRGGAYPARIYAYETLSETNWYAPYVTPAFCPNVFVDISAVLPRKLGAFQCYGSQVQSFPDERSVETLEALARLRGSTVFRAAAEAFVLVREVG